MDQELAQLLIGYVRDALPLGLQDAAQDGAVRIALADGLTKQISYSGNAAGRNGARNSSGVGATAGLIIACSVLFLSIGMLGAYGWSKYRRGSGNAFRKKGRSRMETLDSSSLTHTYQATESDESEARDAAQNSLPNVKRTKTSFPAGEYEKRRDHDFQVFNCSEPYDWRPTVVELGPSFDPERDRYLQAMEELSSVPPSYAKHLPMSSELGYRDIQIV
jgi:hypothetical protein